MYLHTRVEDNRRSAALLQVAFLSALYGAPNYTTHIDEIINRKLIERLVSLAKKKKLNNTTIGGDKRNGISLNDMVKMFTYERLVQAIEFVRKEWEKWNQKLVRTEVGLKARDIMDKLLYYNDVCRFLHSSITHSREVKQLTEAMKNNNDPNKSLNEVCLALGIDKYPLVSNVTFENIAKDEKAFEAGLAIVKTALKKRNSTGLKYLQCDWNSVADDPNEILGETDKLEADKCSKLVKAIEDLNLAFLETGRELTDKQKNILYDPVIKYVILGKGYEWFEKETGRRLDTVMNRYFVTFGRYGSDKENIKHVLLKKIGDPSG